MALLPITQAHIQEAATAGLIPEGEYKAVVISSEIKATKSGQSLNLKFVITEGKFMNSEIIHRLNIINENPKTQAIANSDLIKIAEYMGMSSGDLINADSSILHNKPIVIKTKIEAGVGTYTTNDGETKENRDKSVIKGFAKVPGVGIATPSATQAVPVEGKMPWQ